MALLKQRERRDVLCCILASPPRVKKKKKKKERKGKVGKSARERKKEKKGERVRVLDRPGYSLSVVAEEAIPLPFPKEETRSKRLSGGGTDFATARLMSSHPERAPRRLQSTQRSSVGGWFKAADYHSLGVG
jgi:hypothetical protein